MIDFIAKIFGYVMNFIYVMLGNMGVTNLGLTIILFAAFVQLILFPFIYIQQKKSKVTQVIQPELNKISRKYRDKKDQESMLAMQQEQSAIYKKYGTSPTSGCLPMIIQMIILFGVIKIIYNIPNYIDIVGKSYTEIAKPMVVAMKEEPSIKDDMEEIAKELQATRYYKDPTSVEDVVSVVYRFKDETYEKAREIFKNHPDVLESISVDSVKRIRSLNNFIFKLNVSDYPNQHGVSIYLLIPFLAALFQWLQTKTIRQPEMTGDQAAMGNYMKVMTNTMPIVSLIFYYSLPCGIGLYWAAKALFNVIQQVGFNIYFDHVDIDEMIAKQKEKAEKSGKKSFYEKMMEASSNAADTAGTNPKTPDGTRLNKSNDISKAAKISTKGIEYTPVERTVKDEVAATDSKKDKKKYNGFGDIAKLANMMDEGK
ncbi:MAG: YidC/Oxa1 family membrane protein insertase [Lachnospiraceae bacterium]|nr:YidC/Oxa1 family membrane protein insertase [Lachnospiraceae bacterium]